MEYTMYCSHPAAHGMFAREKCDHWKAVLIRAMNAHAKATLILASFALIVPWSAVASDSTLIEFKIKDQFKHKHTDEEFRGSVLVVVGSDKHGSQYNGPWTKAIYDSLKIEVDSGLIKIVDYADTRGVPFFLKGMVRGKFPKEDGSYVLLDWKGKLAKAYDFEEKKCNVLIIDTGGILRYRTSVTTVEPDDHRIIVDLLRELTPAAGGLFQGE